MSTLLTSVSRLRFLVGNCNYSLQSNLFLRRSYKVHQSKRDDSVRIVSVVPGTHHSAKVIFDDDRAADFKYVWLRDNCKCAQCVHQATGQKLLDTPSIDLAIRPHSIQVNPSGHLLMEWNENGHIHQSVYDSQWLQRYGECFINENFTSGEDELRSTTPAVTLWDRTTIWKNFPEISYQEFIESDQGLKMWLEMFHRFGVALIRQVPVVRGKIVDVVRRFAYVKETSYGLTFDVIAEPDPEHLAFTGAHLHHHTDMNYREKSPGMQLLHCLKSTVLKSDNGVDPGGMSFFADGFRAAKWLRENEAAAFHILTATPVRFQIKVNERRFSQIWPIICLDNEGNVSEIHYNNRTMGPLQAPTHLVTPFYHAYNLFTEKIRAKSMQLALHLQPGDLVAFNNRRVLHGRTQFDENSISRQSCTKNEMGLKLDYVDHGNSMSIMALGIDIRYIEDRFGHCFHGDYFHSPKHTLRRPRTGKTHTFQKAVISSRVNDMLSTSHRYAR